MDFFGRVTVTSIVGCVLVSLLTTGVHLSVGRVSKGKSTVSCVVS